MQQETGSATVAVAAIGGSPMASSIRTLDDVLLQALGWSAGRRPVRARRAHSQN